RGLDALEDDFEAKTGIKANINVVGQNVFENRITLSFIGRTGDVDVVHTPVITVQRWVEAGWLYPMTDYIAGMDGREDILSGPLDAYLVEGDRWSLPFFAETGLMAYRTDILAEAGYDTAPETWEDMLEVAASVHNDDTSAVAMRAAPGQGFNMFIIPMITRAYGGTFFADYPHDLTPAMNTPENLEGLEVYSTLLNDYGPPGVGNFNFGEVAASMQSGKVAMIVDGTSVIAQVLDPDQSQYADRISIAPAPRGPAGRSPAIAVHGLAIPADARAPEAAFKFIEWATSEEVLTQIALEQPFPDFTRASVSENRQVQAKYATVHPDFLELRVEALNEAIGHYRPLLPEWPEIGAAVGENINSAINGLLSNRDALQAADLEIEAIMNDAR
ncbi:MAG: sugar ABC transporter substrate-binding protein, partial [Henriciella sp.]|nr:sugar ABC transporter substrate-binding protein [Henriciella sp.]